MRAREMQTCAAALLAMLEAAAGPGFAAAPERSDRQQAALADPAGRNGAVSAAALAAAYAAAAAAAGRSVGDIPAGGAGATETLLQHRSAGGHIAAEAAAAGQSVTGGDIAPAAAPGQAEVMEAIDGYFRRDSRRYDGRFAEE